MYTYPDIHESENLRNQHNFRKFKSYAIQSQYSASRSIVALSRGYQARICPDADIDLFYIKIFDIYTAEGIGLDNWGLILQMSRTIADPDTGVEYTLNDNYYRLLLLYKALGNISASTAEAQNVLLTALIDTGIGAFGGDAYVLEVDTMVIRWVFEDFLTPEQLAIFKVAGTLARGAGVGWELYAINPDKVFGFDGSGMHPFNQAPFAPDDALVAHRG